MQQISPAFTPGTPLISLETRLGLKLVADANVLLSAVMGGRASTAILRHVSVEQVFTNAFTISEVRKYTNDQLAKKKGIPLDLLLMALTTLPVTVIKRTDYDPFISSANQRIGRRDPKDVELLALARHLNLPVWSNDNDFEDAGIEWLTSAQLLALLDAPEIRV